MPSVFCLYMDPLLNTPDRDGICCPHLNIAGK
jgi:hypothetical protein